MTLILDMKPIGKIESVRAVLAIMMRSGAIDDFELHEFGIRIWPSRDNFHLHLHKQIMALLPRNVEERHVTIVQHGASGGTDMSP